MVDWWFDTCGWCTDGVRQPERGVIHSIEPGKRGTEQGNLGKFNRKALIRLPVVATDLKGRNVAPPTIEFRLPDGAAHPYLLLAGVAQAMVLGKSLEAIDQLLENTSALKAMEHPESVARVPRNLQEVGVELERHRQVFEQGNVFPDHALSKLIDRLKQ